MKYLKTYELFEFTTLKFNYSVGDYVYLDLNQINKNDRCEPLGKITNCNANIRQIGSWDYLVNVFFPEENRMDYVNILEEVILRKLFPKEIEEYEAKKDAVNYNL